MKKTLLLPLLFCCQIIFAQKQVTNLHYTYVEKSAKKPDGVLKREYNFNWNPETQVLVVDKSNPKGDIYPRFDIDQKRRIIVVQMAERNEYVLEESDSFFLPPFKLEPNGETKEINGFKCSGYTCTNEVKLGGAGRPTITILEEYTAWITEELQFNNEVNSIVLALLRNQSAQGGSFKGVIVQMDCKMTYGKKKWDMVYALNISKLDQKLKEPLKWPWEMNNGVAWVESPQLNGGNTLLLFPGWKANGNLEGIYREGDGSAKIMNKRLKMLLKEITGQENPKTKNEYFQNIFVRNAWSGD